MQDYFDFLNQSPTAFHTVKSLTRRFKALGFQPLQEGDRWSLQSGNGYLVERNGGGLMAFRMGGQSPTETGFRVASAHTDSPGLKIKLLSQEVQDGFLRLGIEIYGGPIYSTWLDRELSLAGQIILKSPTGLKQILVDFEEPIALIPNLAIHYNRDVNKGVALDPQSHLQALVPLGESSIQSLEGLLAQRFDFRVDQFLDADLYLYSPQKAQFLGPAKDVYLSGHIDNLEGCYAVFESLKDSTPDDSTIVGLFFDHEEIGSLSPSGAQSSFFSEILERIVKVQGGSDEDYFRAKSKSYLVSIDGAHGVHPNYRDKHDKNYAPILGGGPVLKVSAGLRYSTNSSTGGRIEGLCRDLKIPLQRYIIRSDLAAGSTVGPMASALAGLEAVDIGVPMWGMHSIRESSSLSDHRLMVQLLREFYNGRSI